MDAGAGGFADFAAARGAAPQRTAWLLTGDWGLAQDLVRSSLAQVWPRWERITRHDDPEIYVRRVMVNTWPAWRRRRWLGEHASRDPLDCPAPGDVAAEVALRLAVRQLLAALTGRQRTVVVLRIFDDLSEAQVARVLGCSVGTVRSTMSQALARLRDDPALAELTEREIR